MFQVEVLRQLLWHIDAVNQKDVTEGVHLIIELDSCAPRATVNTSERNWSATSS